MRDPVGKTALIQLDCLIMRLVTAAARCSLFLSPFRRPMLGSSRQQEVRKSTLNFDSSGLPRVTGRLISSADLYSRAWGQRD